MKSILIIVALGILTLMSFVLMRGLQHQFAKKLADSPTREIATAYQVSGKYFSADYQLLYQLKSDEVIEYSNGAGTRLKQPTFEAFDENNQLLWQGQSNTALLANDKNKVTLSDNVTIVQSPNGERPIQAKGNEMYYDVLKHQIISEQAVKVTSEAGEQTTSRLVLNTQTDRLTMDGQISAQYQAPKTH